MSATTERFEPVRARHFTRVADLSPAALDELLELARRMKRAPLAFGEALRGQAIACIFDKPSTRTRVSFGAAAARLGATPLALTPQELQLGRGETIADTARSLSAYVAAIVVRTFAQETIEELARWSDVPVVNALSDEHHPCQALADLLTISERFGDVRDRRLVFVGDGGDNVARSLLEIGALAGLDVTVACPRDYVPDPLALEEARALAAISGAELAVVHDAAAAVAGADAVYADVWASMGEEPEREERRHAFASYQVTGSLMALAKPEAIFLHCLPARRGEEVAADVLDGPRSAVWKQSANRLPTEQALLWTLTREASSGGASASLPTPGAATRRRARRAPPSRRRSERGVAGAAATPPARGPL
jgi:ornithine carbamoyltransferase